MAAKPQLKAGLESQERACHYSKFSLEANPAAADRVELLDPVLEELTPHRQALRQADLKILALRARVAYWDVQLGRQVKGIGAAARLIDTQHPSLKVYKGLFGKQNPSEMTRPSGIGLRNELESVQALRQACDLLPAGDELRPVLELLPKLDTIRTEAGLALSRLEAALDERRQLMLRTPGIKQRIRTAFERLLGQLKDRFPDDPDLIESFFIPEDVRTTPAESEGNGNEPDNEPEGNVGPT